MGYLATSLGYNDPLRLWRSMTNHTWRCKDGKYIVFYTRPADNPPKLLNALGFSKQEIEKMLPMLETPEGRKEYFGLVERKIETWNSDDLEKRIIELNATATIVGQTREGFLASEHGQIAQKWPVMELFKREGWAPSPWPELVPGKHGILHGIKVLEVTRVLLGPRAGCLLAALGATVVRVNSPLIDEGPVLDVNLGKTSLHLELKKDADRKVFEELVRDADVILSKWVRVCFLFSSAWS